jgi:cytochrome c oxidase subunit IV
MQKQPISEQPAPEQREYEQDAPEHIASPGLYIGIFLTLLVFTAVTVLAAGYDLNERMAGLNAAVALIIASIKASLVLLFFMHLRYSPKRTQLVIIASLFWLGIMLLMTMSDYLSRPWS